MLRRLAAFLCLFSMVALCVFAQGLDTKASKDDWEEINFEFNSSVLVDGFPSLLRLAELLEKNPGYKVKVVGNTDNLGTAPYNEKLGLARANTVRDFLIKYHARPEQIEVSTRGKTDPRATGYKSVYTKTDEARWMNRRVVLTVMDAEGRTIGAGGAGEVIRAIEQAKPAAAGPSDCCSEILKRLDKLDDIARMLQNLADQNAALKQEVEGLKQQQQVLESKVNQQPKPLTEQKATEIAKEAVESARPKKFQLMGLNLGADQNGNVTFTGKARYFSPFGNHYAFQAQGEYMYFKTQKEGQLDFGLVDRLGSRFQAGLFSSFKHVSLAGNQTGGTLGQGALTLDYIFKYGKIGVFGTKGFMDNALIDRRNAVVNGMLANNILIEKYLKIVDQAGVSGTFSFVGNSYIEGNIGYLKSFAGADRPGGTLRFVLPINDKIAFTVEGGVNETLLQPYNTGRAVFGVQFGNLLRPKEFLGMSQPIPVDVPRVRYEVLSRTVRVGNSPPVADAGPNQIGVPAGTITLDGSNSYDPDGDPMTFQWVEDAGPAVTLSGANTSKATFTAASNQTYSFRLTVKDDHGGQSSARVSVTTQADQTVKVYAFTANPSTISLNESSTLSWNVQNATSVTITGIGTVQNQGTSVVSPADTTTYTLTATNATSTDTASVTVVVQKPETRLLACYVTPTNIIAGESATLNWQSENASKITITPGIGDVAQNGNVAVTPTATTTYTLTANGVTGNATCNLTVTVTPGQLPRIVRFSGAPVNITAGQTATLLWVVDNATTVNISTLGDVSLTGTQDITPAQTTTYTLTATNKQGSVTAQATVNVAQIPQARILSFYATPAVSPAPGANVLLTCSATNINNLFIVGDGPRAGPTTWVVVRPTQDTTYTCIGNAVNSQDSKTITVKVVQSGAPPAGTPPTVVIQGAPMIQSTSQTLTLDASASSSPSGATPLQFNWTVVGGRATIMNGNTATPTVSFTLGDTYYIFNVTVTDSAGNSATNTVTVQYPIIPTFPPNTP